MATHQLLRVNCGLLIPGMHNQDYSRLYPIYGYIKGEAGGGRGILSSYFKNWSIQHKLICCTPLDFC